MAEGQAAVGNEAFDLVEFGQVRGVDGFVAENTVDGKVLGGTEFLLLASSER